jgi:hypothetical protein
VKESPRVVALVPYFVRYLETGEYPDGRGRLYQPAQLLQLFSLWTSLYNSIKEKAAKNGK